MTSPLLASFASLLESKLKMAFLGQKGEYQDSSWSIQQTDLHQKELGAGVGVDHCLTVCELHSTTAIIP